MGQIKVCVQLTNYKQELGKAEVNEKTQSLKQYPCNTERTEDWMIWVPATDDMGQQKRIKVPLMRERESKERERERGVEGVFR